MTTGPRISVPVELLAQLLAEAEVAYHGFIGDDELLAAIGPEGMALLRAQSAATVTDD